MTTGMIIATAVIIVCSVTAIVFGAINLFSNRRLQKQLSRMSTTQDNGPHLSYEQCNTILENVIDDIWKNKYFLDYRLREVSIIPNMDQEITLFTKEVLASISDRVMLDLLRFYSHDYIVAKILRKSQMLFVDYTNTFKPNTK